MKISEKVTWIGKIDYDLKQFHGEQLSTDLGSSYNSYLIQDEKTAVIDTVWLPYAEEFMANLEKKIDLTKLDYIIVNHAEPDHSGALPLLVKAAPQAKILCTANGAKSIKGYYHQNWDLKIVKTGDKISLGSCELTFIEAPMLHWPDTMMNFLSGDNILFSNDVFGQHFAHKDLTDENVDNEALYYEAIKYFANIIAPFSKKTLKKIEELRSLDLPISMIAPAHGVIWKKDIKTIVEKYIEWSSAYAINEITIIYDTMYDSTEMLAGAIARGIKNELPDFEVKIFNSAKVSSSDIVTEAFRSKGILVGSPTYNNGILNSTAAILEELKGLSLENKKAGAFGSYGWSPVNTKIISEMLTHCGFDIFAESCKVQWRPAIDALIKAEEFGSAFAKFVNQ